MGSNVSKQLAVVLLKNTIRAWHIFPQVEQIPLQGEKELEIGDATQLIDVFYDLKERLKGDGTRIERIHWLIDQNGQTLLHNALAKGISNEAPYQVFNWEWLTHRLNLTGGDEYRLKNTVFPWLLLKDAKAEHSQMKEQLAQEHETEREKLFKERQQLKLENEHLQAQNQALKQMDVENLISYLPALFSEFFVHVGIADLTFLCGKIQVPDVPNPYPELSEETLFLKQKKFRALPREQQGEIVRFVAELPSRQRLKPRSEMRELIMELENE